MRAAERAYSTVRDGILRGRYGAGARLTEQDLASDSGVSRTPVREALRRLHAEGLVEFSPNHGAVVALFEPADAEDIFELRALLEPICARRAAQGATAAQLEELRVLADKQASEARRRTARRLTRISALNDRFHRIIVRAAGSVRLEKALAGLTEAPLILRVFRQYTREELMRSAEQHRELVDALETRDPIWAHSVMHSHIMAGRATYIRSRR